jgi:hypothetical protein
MDSAKPCRRSTSGASAAPAVRVPKVRLGAMVIWEREGMEMIFERARSGGEWYREAALEVAIDRF